jgi:hypothetical protein
MKKTEEKAEKAEKRGSVFPAQAAIEGLREALAALS